MLDPRIFATVFGVIFIAELPDKTAVAALVLATRYRAWPVFTGTALARVLQSLIAVAAGGLLALLPARPVHIGAGALFVISAVFMWRAAAGPDEAVDVGDTPPTHSFKAAFAKSFVVVFLAELGDLTQLGTAALAARFRSPLTVFVSSASALVAVGAIAVFLGNRLSRWINPHVVGRIAAVIFGVLGLGFISGLI
ncbi:MAG: TMEM165/GDT1 family protein [Polyangiaceae bacterium]